MARAQRAAKRRTAAPEREHQVVALVPLPATAVEGSSTHPSLSAGVHRATLAHVARDGHLWVEMRASDGVAYCLKALSTVTLQVSDVGAEVIVLKPSDGLAVVLGKQMMPNAEAPRTEVALDGRRVVLEAADEIVLRCGRASLVLRRNGRIQLKGANVETHAEGVNRIKGGTVQIN